MENLTYTDVPYTELDNWISTNVTEAKDYNINITGEIPAEDLIGTYQGWGYQASTLGLKFFPSIEGVKFNIKFNVSDGITDLSNCFTYKPVYKLNTSLKSVYLTGCKDVTNTGSMFKGCKGLTDVNIDIFTNLTNASGMFRGCSSLTTIVDTTPFANITNAQELFSQCESLTTINTAGFANVTNATWMFRECYKLTDIDTTHFVNVTDASDMFGYCYELTNIDTTPFTKLEKANSMFDHCYNLTDVNTKGFANVTDASNMFSNCTKLKSVDTTPFINVTNASWMFNECYELTDVNTESFTKVDNASNMFTKCYKLTDVNTNSFANVTNASKMFSECHKLTNMNIAPFTKATNTENMFYKCFGLTDIHWGNIKPATNANMFYQCSNRLSIQDIADVETYNWIVNNISNMKMYNHICVFSYDKLDTYISELAAGTYNLHVTNIPVDQLLGKEKDSSLFSKKLEATPQNVFFNLEFDIPVGCTGVNSCFYNNKKIKSIIKINGDVITNGHSMFYGCTELTNINTDAFDNVTDAWGMFAGCAKLKSIDMSRMNKIETALYIVNSCKKIQTIIMPSILLPDTSYTYAFNGNSSLEKVYVKTEEQKNGLALMNIGIDSYDKIEVNKNYYVKLKEVYEYTLLPKNRAETKQYVDISDDSRKLGGIDASQYLTKDNYSTILVSEDGTPPAGAKDGTIYFDKIANRITVYQKDALKSGYEVKSFVYGDATEVNIPEGTYSQDDFYKRLGPLVPRGTYKQCKGTFTVTVEGQTITQTNGYIISSNLYNAPTVILFKDSITLEYNGYNASNPSYFSETRAYCIHYVPMVDKYNWNGSFDTYNYPITIGPGGITLT